MKITQVGERYRAGPSRVCIINILHKERERKKQRQHRAWLRKRVCFHGVRIPKKKPPGAYADYAHAVFMIFSVLGYV